MPYRETPPRHRFVRTSLLLPVLLASACSTVSDITAIEEVNPWDRDILARSNMQLVSDPMQSAVDDHIYFSREASTGGSGVQGGGCGCN